MNLTIKLDDEESCEGCPLNQEAIKDSPVYVYDFYNCLLNYYRQERACKGTSPKRPKRCVEELGI